jgi:hypothetical protein
VLVPVGSCGKLTTLPVLGQTPSWTFAGQIIFASFQDQIITMNADGSARLQRGYLPLHGVFAPSMSQDGALIAFANTAPEDGELNGSFVMNSDGTSIRLVFPGCAPPTLSPDRQWLACTVESHTPAFHREVWKVSLLTGDKTQLTAWNDPQFPDANGPSWSPVDMNLIALFHGKDSANGQTDVTQWGQRQVGVVSAEGGPVYIVTHCHPVATQQALAALAPSDCIDADGPAWSPDGRIIFNRGNPISPAGSGVWIINPDGSGETRLWSDQRDGSAVPARIAPR